MYGEWDVGNVSCFRRVSSVSSVSNVGVMYLGGLELEFPVGFAHPIECVTMAVAAVNLLLHAMYKLVVPLRLSAVVCLYLLHLLPSLLCSSLVLNAKWLRGIAHSLQFLAMSLSCLLSVQCL